MAKNTGADDHAKVKVRVIEFELEGGNATVENSIRQLTTALTNRAVGPKLPPPKTLKELHAGNGAETIEEPETEAIDAQVIDNGDAPPAKKPSRPKKAPKPPTYLPELAAKIGAFKDFAKDALGGERARIAAWRVPAGAKVRRSCGQSPARICSPRPRAVGWRRSIRRRPDCSGRPGSHRSGESHDG